MAAQVVLDLPAEGGFARFRRGLAALTGSVLMVAVVIAAPFTVVVAVGLVSDYLSGGTPDSPPPSGSSVVWGLVAVVGVFVGYRLARWLIRGRRRLGLYLRKFGHGDSTRVLTTALTSAVGRQVRVVTLDDEMVAAVGVDRARRRLAALAFLVFAGLTVWGILWLTNSGGPADEDGGGATSADPWGELMSDIVMVILIFLGLVLTASLALFSGGVYLAAARAGRFAKRRIDSERAIAPTATKIAKLSRKVFSPRLVVVRVASAIWQNTVRGLAGAADVLIIDVSHPTDALLWEVTTMKPLFADRWVLVGAYEHVHALGHPETALRGDPRGLLARQLETEMVIAYGPTPADQSRFVRALRSRLYRARSA